MMIHRITEIETTLGRINRRIHWGRRTVKWAGRQNGENNC